MPSQLLVPTPCIPGLQGQVSVSDLSVEQVEAMAGLATLRRQTVAIGQALSSTRQAVGRKRLISALQAVRL